VHVAGVFLEDRDVELLAGLLMAAGFDEVGKRLALALEAGTEIQALRIDDGAAMLAVLDGQAEGFTELRAALARSGA